MENRFLACFILPAVGSLACFLSLPAWVTFNLFCDPDMPSDPDLREACLELYLQFSSWLFMGYKYLQSSGLWSLAWKDLQGSTMNEPQQWQWLDQGPEPSSRQAFTKGIGGKNDREGTSRITMVLTGLNLRSLDSTWIKPTEKWQRRRPLLLCPSDKHQQLESYVWTKQLWESSRTHIRNFSNTVEQKAHE